jgi:hypothetical protein
MLNLTMKAFYFYLKKQLKNLEFHNMDLKKKWINLIMSYGDYSTHN